MCTENNLIKACVFLQCLLKLWIPAVELALTIDAELAQSTASQTSDRDLQRKLWLRIAEHEIKGKNDVEQALALLKKCPLLEIEDLLPFFDDFQKIDHFKEAICDALKVSSSFVFTCADELIASFPEIQREDPRATPRYGGSC